jgi:ATP-dependent Clp protease ATP-binding subunit ClpA
MATGPVPLDNLISYVRSVHPDGGPLEHLSDAITVAAQLEEQSDVLIGHFVDQARRSGASWSQIGDSMGVSKQAAQKRYVLRDGESSGTGPSFSRFTQRACNTLAAAGRVAAGGEVDVAHLAVGLLAEPQSVAAVVIRAAGVSNEQVWADLGIDAAPGTDKAADETALRDLAFTVDGKAALSGALREALRLGHNYIGTEHLLLGIVTSGSGTAVTLASLGLGREFVEREVSTQLAVLEERKRNK